MTTTRQINEPYGLSPDFERAVVWLACSRPRFWGTIGHAIDSSLLNLAPARLAIHAAGVIAKELGRGPESTVLVVQRIRRWVENGKVALEQCQEVGEMFDQAEDEGIALSEEATMNEVVPIIRKRMQREAIRLGISAQQEDKPLAPVIDLFSKASRLGTQDISLGAQFGSHSIDELSILRDAERLPTGISELDGILDGGMIRGQLGVVGGFFGGGKSMFLTQVAAESIWRGRSCAYATIELPVSQQQARITANLTGISINDILATKGAEAKTALEQIEGKLAPLFFRHFTAQATTVEDVRDWVTGIEAHLEQGIDLVVVDYADKMAAKVTAGKRDGGEYLGMRDVFEGLRVYAEETGKWVWTATQLKRKADKRTKQRADGDDVADSVHKSRVTDILITLNPDEEQTEITYFVAKNRTGRSMAGAGPFTVDWVCGRIAMLHNGRPVHDATTKERIPF